MEGVLKDGKLSGTMITPRGQTLTWVGVPAPSLKRDKAPVWGKPIQLFNGKNLAGWQALGKDNQWIVENGILRSPRTGSNIRTTQPFTDFKLHIEFRYPKESNSGVYLRGMYEVQVVDSYQKALDPHNMGGVYSRITPTSSAEKPAGEWQTMDITLCDRHATVILNGVKIIDNQPIYGPTGGAMKSDVFAAGPIYLQGDHGKVFYKNLVLTPIVK